MSFEKTPIKVVLTGSMSSGKTTIFRQFSQNQKKNVNSLLRKFKFDLDGKVVTVKINLWDTSGMERLVSMSNFHFHGAKAAILCFDVTSITSWHSSLQYFYALKEAEDECRVYVVGTKLDIVTHHPEKRQVRLATASHFATANHSKYFEISALESDDVLNVFEHIAEDYLQDWTVKQQLRIYSERIVVKNKDFSFGSNSNCGFKNCFS